jgi:polygalacturonase
VFDVRDYGAVGDGTTPDTAAIQKALDAAGAAGGGAQVLVRGGKSYLVGPLQLPGGIDFHLADDALLRVSTEAKDYGRRAAINAQDAHGLSITGTGTIDGRSPEFMDHFDAEGEWWRPKAFRPRLVVLTGCRDLEIHDVTLLHAPSWTLHLLGCQHTLVDGIKIRNQLDVPNCDGIDPDHCRDLVIRNCDIACGDDAIVIKTTRQGATYGPSTNIRVSDCVIQTQDAALKIGTETTGDISDVRFERCQVKAGCRGMCIQLRDEGNLSNIEFRDINFVSRFFSDPWWGRGEAISFTAIPRTPQTKVGTLSDVRVINVTGRAENSVRISGSAASRVRNVRLENVAVEFDRFTKYRGGMWDNRPTTAVPGIEELGTPAYSIRHADQITLQNCKATWGKNLPPYFSNALKAEDVTELTYPGFVGTAAHPERDQAIAIS